MKASRIIFVFTAVFILLSCTSTKKQQSEQDSQLIAKVEEMKYKFVAGSANPMGGKNIQLTAGYYSLRITKDTIESFLPYFGRAYVAPMPLEEGGIKFISTDFSYQIKEGKNAWTVTIEPKDTPQKIKMFLDIGKGGYGTLSVQDNSRQAISFYGTIE